MNNYFQGPTNYFSVKYWPLYSFDKYIPIEQGNYTLTGAPIGYRRSYVLKAESGACSLVKPVVSIVWDGTGELDIVTGWIREGYGIENNQSMYTGTNGLDLTGLTNGGEFKFKRNTYQLGDSDITDYDFMTLWLYINSWEPDKHLRVNLDKENVFTSTTLNVDYYVNLTIIRQWQKIHIPLYDFNIPLDAGQLKYVNKLSFSSRGNINLYIDNIAFLIGKVVTRVVSVCSPVVVGRRIGVKVLSGREIELEES